MQELLGITRALSDPIRLRIVMLLSMEELCECQLHYILNIEPTELSKHIQCLVQSGLIRYEPYEDHGTLRTADDASSAVVRAGLHLLQDGLVGDDQIDDDAINMDRVLSLKRDALCMAYQSMLNEQPIEDELPDFVEC